MLSGAGAGRRERHYTMEEPGQTLPGAIASALDLTLNVYQARTGWLPAGWGVLWSLSIEEVFYLAFPIACLLLGRTRLLVPALVVLASSIPVVRASHPSRRDLGGRELPAGHGGDRDRRAGGVARATLADARAPRRGAGRRRSASSACWPSTSRAPNSGNRCASSTMLVLTLSAAALVIASRWRAAGRPDAAVAGVRLAALVRPPQLRDLPDAHVRRLAGRRPLRRGRRRLAGWASPGMRPSWRAPGRWAGSSRVSFPIPSSASRCARVRHARPARAGALPAKVSP